MVSLECPDSATIRPGGYFTRDLSAHIHTYVIGPRCATYYIDDIMFTDDPLLTAKEIKRRNRDQGSNGIATPIRKNGRWRITRDIRLGSNIPGYPKCVCDTAVDLQLIP
ncbi:MAG: hypothetical protein ACREDP_19990 [Bradyrhizobium sp.]